MAKIETTGTTVTEYRAIEIEPDGTKRATYGGWVAKETKEQAEEFLAYFTKFSRAERRGATATSRVVLLERTVQTRYTVIG